MGTISPARSRRILVAVVFAASLTALSAVWIGYRIGGLRATRDVDDAATVLAALAATLACGRAGLRHEGRLRVFWSLLAAACLCWTVAEIVWAVYDLVLRVPVPVPSWADVGYLGAIPVAVGGLLCLPALPRARRVRLRWLADGLIVATALAFLSWTLVIAPLWHSTDLTTLGGLVALAYPFGDVVIVFFIVIAVRRMSGGLALWFLLAGLLLMALSDSAYLTTANSYSSGGLIDVGWIAAYLALAIGGVASDRRKPTVRRIASDTVHLTSFLAPFVPALVALAVIAVELQAGRGLDTASSVIAFALVSLVLVRQALLARELATSADNPEALQIRGAVQLALGKSAGPRSRQP